MSMSEEVRPLIDIGGGGRRRVVGTQPISDTTVVVIVGNARPAIWSTAEIYKKLSSGDWKIAEPIARWKCR
jgi:hypothetical protein